MVRSDIRAHSGLSGNAVALAQSSAQRASHSYTEGRCVIIGFFDTYEDDGGAPFLSKEEKAALVKSGATIGVTNVYAFMDAGQYPGPAYKLVLDIDGEERVTSFKQNTNVDSRDSMLKAMAAHFADSEEAERVDVVLYKVGNAFLLKDANAAE